MRRELAIAFLALTICLSPLSGSFAQGTTEVFESASEAFRQGDYSRALVLFEQARSSGRVGPAVHYNIGVCQYELGRYDQAEATFRLVAENYPEMRALAEYNVGLSLLRQSRDEAAAEHFLYARESGEDEKIVRLADIALRRLNIAYAGVRTQGASWEGLVDVSIGHDDNVALIDESTIPTGQTADSPFAEVVAVITGPLRSGSGFRFDGSLYSVTYNDASEFNQTALRLGGFYQWRQAAWRFDVGPYITRSTLDGVGFEQRLGTSLAMRRSISSSSQIGLRLSHDEVDEISSRYAFIAGSRELLTLVWDKFSANSRVTFEFQREENDRVDPSVSPHRNRLRLRFRHSINSRLTFDSSISLRKSSYDQLPVTRDEDLSEASLGIVRDFPGGWELRGRYLWSDNDSTLNRFSYSRSRTSLGITKNLNR